MRRNSDQVLATAILALLLTGCGGGSGSGNAPVSIPAVTPTPSPAATPSPMPSATPMPSALSQADAQIAPCINLGNHLEAPREGDWGRALTDQDFADIAAKGFRTVRLPARFSAHQSGAPDYAIEPAFLDRVEHLVDIARARGLRVIVDNHNFDELMADPAGRTAQLTAIWKQVAARLRDKDDHVWFELMNEPKEQMTNANLVAVLGPSLAQIRIANPTRIVVIGGESWSSVYNLSTLPVFDDARIVYTFHYYDPFNFTHQGAPWVTPVLPTGITFGSATDLAELVDNVARAKAFMARTGRPLFMGEYGAWEGISLPERAAYYRTVHDAFAAAQVDGCVWAYVNSFPFRDASSGLWPDSLLRAIGM